MISILLCFIALIAPTEYERYDANGNYVSYTQPLYLFWLFMAFCAVFFYIVGNIIFDLMFLGDNQFLYEPDFMAWKSYSEHGEPY